MTDIQTMQRTLKLNNNKINNPILKNGQDLKKKCLVKEEMQIANKHITHESQYHL